MDESSAPSSSDVQLTSPKRQEFSYRLQTKDLWPEHSTEASVSYDHVYSTATPEEIYYFKIYEDEGIAYPERGTLYREENGQAELLAELKGTQAYVQLAWGNRRGVYWLAGDEQAVYCYAFDTKSVSKLELPDKVGYFTLSDDFLVYSVFLEPDDTSVTLRYLSLSGGSPKTVEATLMNPYYVPDIVDDTIAVPLLENGRYSMVIHELHSGTKTVYPLPDEVENLLSIQTNGTTAVLTSLKTPSDYTSGITRIYHMPTEKVIRRFQGSNPSFTSAFFLNDTQLVYCAEQQAYLYDMTTNYYTPIKELSGKSYYSVSPNVLYSDSGVTIVTGK